MGDPKFAVLPEPFDQREPGPRRVVEVKNEPVPNAIKLSCILLFFQEFT